MQDDLSHALHRIASATYITYKQAPSLYYKEVYLAACLPACPLAQQVQETNSDTPMPPPCFPLHHAFKMPQTNKGANLAWSSVILSKFPYAVL